VGWLPSQDNLNRGVVGPIGGTMTKKKITREQPIHKEVKGFK